MYHSINDETGTNPPDLVVTPENFRTHLAYLQKRGYQFLTMSEVISGDYDSAPRVALTFDDGFQDNYTQMFPILKEFGAKATIYLCPDMPKIDKLTREQILEMQASGSIEFGAHTMTHINLSQISDESAIYEITESKKYVEKLTGRECPSFAYPFGRLNDRVAQSVEKAGFLSAVVVKKGIEAIGDKYRIKRLSILRKTNLLQFHIAMTRGRYRV
jgi:peptidoglycan/xylan/chitin deacetylase (PgdA/CDA1 family)